MVLDIVNAVGSGDLNIEINLRELADDIQKVEHDPEKYPGAYVRFENMDPLVILYRTGKYIITGSTSDEESQDCREQFLQFLVENGILDTPDDAWFTMQNYVCTGELKEIQNLNALAIGLGLEYTEYEPEQFPGLIYRFDSYSVVILIFASGKAIVTGAKDVNEAEDAFTALKERLNDLT